MNWFAVYATDTGALVSVGTVLANPLPNGLGAKDVGATRPAGQWNAGTRSFDTPVQTKAPLAVIDFLRRFNMLNEEAPIREAAKTDAVIATFLGRLGVVQAVHLDHPETVAGVNYLAAKGLIATGRVAEILA